MHKVDREPTHDAFGLAVMVFQLLFMGRHPFAGRFGGTGDMPIEKAIKEGRFAYSIQRKAETRMDPPPFVPTLIDITPELAACFERAFPSDPALFKKRPLAADWMHALNRFESELTTCRANPAHYHARNASDCPWCRLENGLGVTLFPLTGITASSAARSSFNLDAAMAAIDRVLGPGEAPNPVQVIPPISGLVKSPAAREIRRDRMTKRVGGLLLAAACIALMISGFPLAFLGLLAAGYMVLGGDDASRRLQADKSRAESDWNAVVKEWENEVGPGRFEHKKMELGKLANEYRLLPALERSRLDDLDRKRREIQLQRFLEGHLIARAKITGIGAGRKATLASYGIENAFDVTFQRVSAVPGFGEVRTKKLVDWRKSVERRFVFNPTLGTDPAAIQQVKDGLARRGIEIEQALARGPIDLEQLRTHAISSRTRPTHRLIEAYRATKQAEIDIS